MIGLFAMIVFVAATAWSAVPVALPSSEDPADWRIPLQLAGLEADDNALVRIVAGPTGWSVETTDAAGAVRRVPVAPPDDAQSREEIAFLARSLAREAGAVPTPAVGPSPGLPPPPPPPSPSRAEALPRSPPSARPAPEASDPEEVDRADVMVAWTGFSLLDRADPTAAAARDGTDADAVQVVPVARPGRRVGVAPMALWLGSASRPGIQASFVFGVGVQLKSWRRQHLELDLRVQPARALQLGGLWRQMVNVDTEVALATSVGAAEFGAGVGASYRIFRQQLNPIDRRFVPVVSGRAELFLVRGRRLSLGLLTELRADLGVFELVREDERSTRLVPLEVGTSLRLRFHGAGDLFSYPHTSRDR